MIAEIKKTVEQKMNKSLETLRVDFSKVRTGRAHPGILDHVMVSYYLIDNRTIGVQPWEKNMVSPIEKAIRDADLGLNPSTNGDVIRVPMPMLTEERRRDLIKVVRVDAESAKVAVRNIRRDANEQLKKLLKDKEIGEDDERRAQEEVQKATDRFVVEIDKALQAKEADLMAV
jgi:ribosome recycling factor